MDVAHLRLHLDQHLLITAHSRQLALQTNDRLLMPCSVEERENGWISLRLGLKLGGDPQMFRDNNVVVLTLSPEAAARCCSGR